MVARHKNLAWLLAWGLVLSGGCGDDVVGEGDACERAQDCEGALVCAKVAVDGDAMVCADRADTRNDSSCMPEVAGMLCPPVLRE